MSTKNKLNELTSALQALDPDGRWGTISGVFDSMEICEDIIAKARRETLITMLRSGMLSHCCALALLCTAPPSPCTVPTALRSWTVCARGWILLLAPRLRS